MGILSGAVRRDGTLAANADARLLNHSSEAQFLRCTIPSICTPADVALQPLSTSHVAPTVASMSHSSLFATNIQPAPSTFFCFCSR